MPVLDDIDSAGLFAAIRSRFVAVERGTEWAGPYTSLWLLPDGRMYDMDIYHGHVYLAYKTLMNTKDLSSTVFISDMLSRGAVRINMALDDALYVELQKPVTALQRSRLGSLVRDAGSVYLDVSGPRKPAASMRWTAPVLPFEFWAKVDEFIGSSRGFARIGLLASLGASALVSKLLGWW